MLDIFKNVIDKWNASRAGRTLSVFNEARGGVLSQGLAYSAIFSIFAGVYVLTAITGIIFQSNSRLNDALLSFISQMIPGLIDTGNGGAINPNELFSVTSLSISGVIVLGVLLFTASGMMTNFRLAISSMYMTDKNQPNFILLKLLDLAATFALGLLVIISMVFSILGTRALAMILNWLNLDFGFRDITLNLSSIGIALLLDTFALFMLFYAQARVPVRKRIIALTSLVGAIGFGALKWAGATLALGGGSNPLFQGFLVIVGLLVWFNLVMRWLLLLAAWMATGKLKTIKS